MQILEYVVKYLGICTTDTGYSITAGLPGASYPLTKSVSDGQQRAADSLKFSTDEDSWEEFFSRFEVTFSGIDLDFSWEKDFRDHYTEIIAGTRPDWVLMTVELSPGAMTLFWHREDCWQTEYTFCSLTMIGDDATYCMVETPENRQRVRPRYSIALYSDHTEVEEDLYYTRREVGLFKEDDHTVAEITEYRDI